MTRSIWDLLLLVLALSLGVLIGWWVRGRRVPSTSSGTATGTPAATSAATPAPRTAVAEPTAVQPAADAPVVDRVSPHSVPGVAGGGDDPAARPDTPAATVRRASPPSPAPAQREPMTEPAVPEPVVRTPAAAAESTSEPAADPVTSVTPQQRQPGAALHHPEPGTPAPAGQREATEGGGSPQSTERASASVAAADVEVADRLATHRPDGGEPGAAKPSADGPSADESPLPAAAQLVPAAPQAPSTDAPVEVADTTSTDTAAADTAPAGTAADAHAAPGVHVPLFGAAAEHPPANDAVEPSSQLQTGPVDAPVGGSAETTAPTEGAGATTSAVGGADPAAADDFRRLAGIGPKVANALHAAGIHTFAQLADTDVATLREVTRRAGVRSAPTLATWPQQARALTAAQ